MGDSGKLDQILGRLTVIDASINHMIEKIGDRDRLGQFPPTGLYEGIVEAKTSIINNTETTITKAIGVEDPATNLYRAISNAASTIIFDTGDTEKELKTGIKSITDTVSSIKTNVSSIKTNQILRSDVVEENELKGWIQGHTHT